MICAPNQFLLFSSMAIFLPKFCFCYEITHIQQLDFLLHFNNLCLQLCMRILTVLSNSLTAWETIWISPQEKKKIPPLLAQQFVLILAKLEWILSTLLYA